MIAQLRQALRGLCKSPVFSLTVIATLGLGIGLNAAIFTVVDTVLLRPLGYHDADRIVAVRTRFAEGNRTIPRLGGGDYTDLAHDVRGFESTAYFQSYSDGLQLRGAAFYVPIAQVSPRFAEVLGVQPVAGRLFQSTDLDGTDVLLSAEFTRNHFDSPGAALGQTIAYNGHVYTIAGILPAGFSFPDKTQVWFERTAQPDNTHRDAYNQQAIAKRRAEITQAQLNAELAGFSSNLSRQFPEDRGKSVEAVLLQEQIVGPIRPMLHLLMGAVLILVLIVCVNIAHLQLIRSMRQLRSSAIRTALGASRIALVRYALTEIAVLAVAGTGAAILLALPTLKLLLRLAPADVPRLADVHLNVDVFLFSLLMAFFVLSLATMLPVWLSWHLETAAALRSDSARSTESRSSLRLRNSFLITEMTLTLTLSIAAVLLTRQLIAQSRQDLGFSPDHLLVIDAHSVLTTSSPVAADQSPEALAALRQAERNFEQSKLNRMDANLRSLAIVPGVDSVAAVSGAPMGFGASDVGYAIRGRQIFAPGAHLAVADFRPITPGFFATVGVPLLHGRGLNAQDRFDSPGVVLVNRALADSVFPGQDTLGQQIMCGYDSNVAWLTIVGVVENIRTESPAVAATPAIYAPVAQHPNPASDMQFIVRTRLAPSSMVDTLRSALLRSDPGTAVKVSTMHDNIGLVQQAEHFRTLLFALFAAVSILLAAEGMYGVTAYTVSQRRFEFGLRMALGANRSAVLGLVLRKSAALAVVGIVLGISLSLLLARLLGSLLGELPAFDLFAYVIASASILFLSVLATLLPARAAASVDPMRVLRSE